MSRSYSRSRSVSASPVALDDPVPSGSSVDIVAPHRCDRQPHAIETAVRRKLAGQTGVQFLELVVRRVPDGVCLEGVVQMDDDALDIAEVVREISGVEEVINHLLILPTNPRACEADEEAASAI